MNFAIIGLGQIGIYHARDFIKNGCQLKAIMCSTLETGKKKQLLLKEKYDIHVNYYIDIDELFLIENLHLLVICSPTETHYKYIKSGIKNRIKNIFCEKPFIYNNANNYKRSLDLINDCKKKKN